MAKKLGRGLEGLFKQAEPVKIGDTIIPTKPQRSPDGVGTTPTPATLPSEIIPVGPATVAPPPLEAIPTTKPEPMPMTQPVAGQMRNLELGIRNSEIQNPTSPQAVPHPAQRDGKSEMPADKTAPVPVFSERAPPPEADAPVPTGEAIIIIKTEQLIPNRFQPRKTFDKESLTELIESIRTAGVLQPILVRKSGNYYEIVAGERRWRACVELKLPTVPVIVKEVDDQKMLEWALIENTQRKDLNPIERARAYKELMIFFNLTQEEIARRVGLDRATVANFIRLLDLPNEVQEELAHETISTTHGRSLLAIDDPALQVKLAQRIRKEGMSVRRLEYIIRWLKRRRALSAPATAPSGAQQLQIREIEDRLMRKFNTKTIISTLDNKQGKIIISFYSVDDFQRILDKIDQIQ